jgi:2-polyprenyl-3-methyl-5-hydroxy-6-metoxy-1,4-benzoquinol methylase
MKRDRCFTAGAVDDPAASFPGPVPEVLCTICGYRTPSADEKSVGSVRGNTEKYQNTYFRLWKCPQCSTVQSLDPVDYKEIYQNYPLNQRKEDSFARATLGNLMGRLQRAGMTKQAAVLDYGCGNGIFVNYLRRHGFSNVVGYDPFVESYSHSLSPQVFFDVIVVNDVIEHCEDVRAIVRDCRERLRPKGLLYIGTVESDGLDMEHLEPHTMKLHQPFHRVFLKESVLHGICREFGFDIVATYKRSYLDTLVPFANYRFLDELSKAMNHNMDRMLQGSGAFAAFLKRPQLLFFGFFGYFFPSAFEPAVIVRKQQ